MTKVGLIKFITLFFLSSVVSVAYGQKVKYKDIFGLLSTKQYEQAEPFLKRYLKENDDNPNAYLFMGVIYQEKSAKNDLLKQTSLAVANMDSAIQFFDKAYKTIDDREVRRNKEYYQNYNRRDLRTGEFGVKLSDIQFDIEKKIEGLRERIDRVKMVKYYFTLADTMYKKSNAQYRALQKKYAKEQALYLRADENTLKGLELLSARYDSCTKAFENYKASSSNLGKTGYNQTLTPMAVSDFSKDGATSANFYQDDLSVWDYKKFAEKSKEIIEKEIMPMRDHLVQYDIEINKLRERLNTDSVSVRNDLTRLIDKLLYDKLKKFDPDPLPMAVFSLKISDLEYRSSLLEHKTVSDTTDVHLRLNAVKTEIKFLNRLDSIASKLSGEDMDKEALDYDHFIVNTYSNTVVLKSYVKALKEYAIRERRKKDAQLTVRLKAMDWIIDQSDSVPLIAENANDKFKPLFSATELYTAGLTYADSTNVEGYFYTITPSRIPSLKVKFPVDKAAFKHSKLANTKALTYSDDGGQIYFVLIYSDKPLKEKYPVTLAKIYRSDGLAWSSNMALAFAPKEIFFKPDAGEVTIKNDGQTTVIDKNGKVLR